MTRIRNSTPVAIGSKVADHRGHVYTLDRSTVRDGFVAVSYRPGATVHMSAVAWLELAVSGRHCIVV